MACLILRTEAGSGGEGPFIVIVVVVIIIAVVTANNGGRRRDQREWEGPTVILISDIDDGKVRRCNPDW